MPFNKKLIEVALPLDAINKASAREKSIRHGHPGTLHLWWARRPLAAARAVIFSQMVDDPSAHPEQFPTEESQEKERQRLFRIIEDLVKWENTTNEVVINQARDEIWKNWRSTCAENKDHPCAAELFNPDKLPAFHDPFAGGGALPLEAQRLGMEVFASDLNPVAVLINKAMIEIPPKFIGQPPVNPESRKEKSLFKQKWGGAKGLAEDVRYYSNWMHEEARKRIGHLYPEVEITSEMATNRPDLMQHVGRKLTVIVWLWARTVKSPNPAFASVDVPLTPSFMLSSKTGKEAYIEPVIENGGYRFTVKVGRPPDEAKKGTKLSRGANFRCLMSGTPISSEYIMAEGRSGRIQSKLMGIVAASKSGRVYLSPTPEMEKVAFSAEPSWKPDLEFFKKGLGFRIGNYGYSKWCDFFTNRQLVALTTYCDLIHEVRKRVKDDAHIAGLSNDDQGINVAGSGATAYAEALTVYLACCVSRASDYWSSSTIWESSGGFVAHVFTRNALPMSWDYPESNPFSDATGNWTKTCVDWVVRVVQRMNQKTPGLSIQADAQMQEISSGKIVSTDPPYYDNIGYADLSDFFYVWLRRSLKPVFPELFATVAVPKAEELVATPARHGGRQQAESFFMKGMTRAMHLLSEKVHPVFPVTIYYAFKQSETKEKGTASTGWEAFLDAAIKAGFTICGTWPIRTERPGRMREYGSNALASSIVLVCRPRSADALTVTRRDFVTALKAELPVALYHLQHGNIAPVDLAQAAIGPGMAMYTRYASVLDVEGKPLSVREALALINQTLDETLAEQESDFDSDSRWALAWIEQFGFAEGEYGVAETLSKAKNTSVAGMEQAGILTSKGGKVRLLKPGELSADWNPKKGSRLTVWEMVHQFIRALESEGEPTTAKLVARIGTKADSARELAYRLYNLCERKKRAQEALSYNGLVQSWPEISRLASAARNLQAPIQSQIFEEE